MDRQNSDDIMKFLDGMASSDDVLFGFLDEGNQSLEDYSGNLATGEESDADNDTPGCNSEKNRTFWYEQEQLLQVIFNFVDKFKKTLTIILSSLIKGPIMFVWGLINFVLDRICNV